MNFAAGEIMSGQHDLAIGGGVESMSRVGIGASGGAWPVDPAIAIPSYFMPQGVSADLIATKYGFTRDDVDTYAVRSQQRAAKAWDEGRFDALGDAGEGRNGITLLDQGRAYAARRPHAVARGAEAVVHEMGEIGGFDAVAIQAHPEVEFVNHVHHAGNSSGIVDGAAAVLLGNKEAGEKAGLKPRARMRAFANIGSDPALMLTGPVDVTEKALKRAGMKLSDIDLFEVNEAFASVVLRYLQAFDLDHAKVNVNGGAIALGHPLGATGAMILGTLLDELERRNLAIGAGHALHRRRHGHRDDHRAGVSEFNFDFRRIDDYNDHYSHKWGAPMRNTRQISKSKGTTEIGFVIPRVFLLSILPRRPPHRGPSRTRRPACPRFWKKREAMDRKQSPATARRWPSLSGSRSGNERQRGKELSRTSSLLRPCADRP